MSCGQIAAELMPCMKQMTGSTAALGQTTGEVVERGKQHVAEETPKVTALTAAATAAMADPTGISSRAAGRAEVAGQQEAWQRTLAKDKPLNDTMQAQANTVVGQAQHMQSDARLQRLMELAQQKNCQ